MAKREKELPAEELVALLKGAGFNVEIIQQPTEFFLVDRSKLEAILASVMEMTIAGMPGSMKKNLDRTAALIVQQFVERGWLSVVEVSVDGGN